MAGLVKVENRIQAVADSGSFCDMCTNKKRRAAKSCQQCMISYCQEHLQPHYDVPALKKHKLMGPEWNLQDNICSRHNEVKKIFCRTDQECICYLCHIDEHKDHDTVSAEAFLSQKKIELQAGQLPVKQRMQVLKGNIALLQEELTAIDESADKVLRESDQLQQLIEQRNANLREKIKKQKEIEETRVQALLKKLQQELTVESERDTKLEQLLHVDDYTEFLKKYSAYETKWKNHRSPSTTALQRRPLRYFAQVSKDMLEVNRICSQGFQYLAQRVTEVDVLLQQDPQINEEFIQYSYQLTLDKNTARGEIVFSEENTKVTSVREGKASTPHKDRFLDKSQVLSTNALPLRCYFEVEWTGLSITVGVVYKDIERQGPKSAFGSKDNDKSWVLECPNKKAFIYRHNGEQKILSPCVSSRVGVFLDQRAGILCFYEVSETNKLIHKVKTTFTQPLYAGLGLYFFSVTAKMCVKGVRQS